MARAAEFPRQVGYQNICPQGTLGCGVRTLETSPGVLKDTVERLPDCTGAICSPDQKTQLCGQAVPREAEVRSICPRLTPGNCAVLVVTVTGYVESLRIPRPGCPGAAQVADIPQQRLEGSEPIPRIGAFVCGLDTASDLRVV